LAAEHNIQQSKPETKGSEFIIEFAKHNHLSAIDTEKDINILRYVTTV
jgi:hypothetical protein